MHSAILAYLIFCAGIFSYCMARGLYEDFVAKQQDIKFGKNFQWPPHKSTFFWMTFMVSCPIVNFALLLVVLWVRYISGRR